MSPLSLCVRGEVINFVRLHDRKPTRITMGYNTWHLLVAGLEASEAHLINWPANGGHSLMDMQVVFDYKHIGFPTVGD